MNLTFIYCTNRDHPNIKWFLDSLANQCVDGDHFKILVIKPSSANGGLEFKYSYDPFLTVQVVQAKPTTWSGPSRLTRQDWWSKANSLNTGLCLARTDWVSFIDDRSVLMPGYLEIIRKAMTASEPYVLLGSYEKRHSVKVESGVITHGGIVTGEDGRVEHCRKYWVLTGLKPPFTCGGEWAYGCSVTLPIEWALEVNGVDETCDGLSGEDSIFGLMIQNNRRPFKFDPRMKIVEDRTPDECGPIARREDFGVSPADYSHKLLEMLRHRKTAGHPFNIRELRDNALAGKPWPAPWGPTHHLWNNVPLEEL